MEKQNRYDAVIFDLDGTLLNSIEDLCDSANAALAEMGYPQRTLEEVRAFVGNGVGKLMERAVPQGTAEEKGAEALKIFRRHYNEHMEDKTRPYPGVPELLKKLKEQGYGIGVVSNKYDGAVKHLCSRFFPDLIDAAAGEREKVRPKPAPDSVFQVLAQLNTSPERAVYVGDSGVDMETARNSGTVAVGVAWGFRSVEELRSAGAQFIIGEALQLETLLTAENPGERSGFEAE